MGVGGGRSAVSYSAVSPAFPLFIDFFFLLHCFNFFHPSKLLTLSFDSAFVWVVFLPLETQIHTEQKEWERERGSECCDRSAVRSADSCPPFELSADLLPLPVELRDVLQLHARGARRLNRRLGGKKKKHRTCKWMQTGGMKPAFTFCYIDLSAQPMQMFKHVRWQERKIRKDGHIWQLQSTKSVCFSTEVQTAFLHPNATFWNWTVPLSAANQNRFKHFMHLDVFRWHKMGWTDLFIWEYGWYWMFKDWSSLIYDVKIKYDIGRCYFLPTINQQKYES